jgi:hypothetical protein
MRTPRTAYQCRPGTVDLSGEAEPALPKAPRMNDDVSRCTRDRHCLAGAVAGDRSPFA